MSIRETNLSTLGEFGLLDQLQPLLKTTLAEQMVGMGDDCAVVPAGGGVGYHLFTIDTLIDQVHFRRDFSTAYDIGWKSLAVSMSDVAAMGGVPLVATVSLMLTEDLDSDFVADLYRGLVDVATTASVAIVGGDTVRAKQFGLTTTLFGNSPSAPILRSGAQSGDDLWISGEIGAALAGLKMLQAGDDRKGADETTAHTAHRRPTARVELGRRLRATGLVHAAIDVSDGLLQDLGHIVRASGVGALLRLESVPRWSAGDSRQLAAGASSDDDTAGVIASLCGGDDYELLFTAPSTAQSMLAALGAEPGLPRLTRIGACTQKAPLIEIECADGSVHASETLLAAMPQVQAGYQHFYGSELGNDE